MTWDTTISIEGVATAAGVLGAAMGYVVDLFRKWSQAGKDRRRRGTYSAILHFLEDDLLRGLTEDQLWDKYNSPDSSDIRRRYNALRPDKIDRVRFEALIRDLRLDGLIELVGRDQYRLETRYLDKYDLQNESRAAAVETANQLLSREMIADRTRAVLLDKSVGRWQRKEALDLLMRVSPQEAVQHAARLLTSDNHDEALIGGEVLAELQPAGKLTRT